MWVATNPLAPVIRMVCTMSLSLLALIGVWTESLT